MEQSANLQLPYIMPSQAQKHVTHNEAIRILDALVQLTVLDRHLFTPPAAPNDGDRYLVAPGGLGAWTGKDGKLAAWQDGAWAFLAPKAGWLLWVADENRLIGFDGAAWIDAAVHSVNPAPLVGVNATADATNRLVVKSPASLFDAEAGDHRIKINKTAAVDTASLVFQSGYSGRAEFGLAGDDDWHVKVSADGAAWTEALRVDRTTGRVSLPAALALGDENQVVTRRHVRELLTANRTYYVRTNGNDSNTGLVDSSGGAFLTCQKAYDTIAANLDLGGKTVTVQVADGTYSGGILISQPWTGGGAVAFVGNSGSPGNVIISTTAARCLNWTCNLPGALSMNGFKVQTTTSGDAIRGDGAGTCTLSNMEYGPCAGRQLLLATPGANFLFGGTYTISGGAASHWVVESLSRLRCDGKTITITGTPAFSTAFAQAHFGAVMQVNANTFSGSATGRRYQITTAGGINTAGGGATYLPGSGSPSDILTSPGWYL